MILITYDDTWGRFSFVFLPILVKLVKLVYSEFGYMTLASNWMRSSFAHGL